MTLKPFQFGSGQLTSMTWDAIDGITLVSTTSSAGTGTFGFKKDFGLPVGYWTAPGDSPGSGILLNSDGTKVITSDNGETLTIIVDSSELPDSDIDVDITITKVSRNHIQNMDELTDYNK